MKNNALTGVIIYCKNCKYRYTEDCPMYFTIVPNGRYSEAYFIDRTEDYWFCSEGEEENDA